jgi:hypothetical protein
LMAHFSGEVTCAPKQLTPWVAAIYPRLPVIDPQPGSRRTASLRSTATERHHAGGRPRYSENPLGSTGATVKRNTARQRSRCIGRRRLPQLGGEKAYPQRESASKREQVSPTAILGFVEMVKKLKYAMNPRALSFHLRATWRWSTETAAAEQTTPRMP